MGSISDGGTAQRTIIDVLEECSWTLVTGSNVPGRGATVSTSSGENSEGPYAFTALMRNLYLVFGVSPSAATVSTWLMLMPSYVATDVQELTMRRVN